MVQSLSGISFPSFVIARGVKLVLSPLLLFFAAPAVGADLVASPTAPAPVLEQVQGSTANPGADEINFQGVIVERQVMIRIPASRPPSNGFSNYRANGQSEAPMRVKWREVKAPRCIPMRNILGVQYTQRSSIDLLTRERQRLRAALDGECRAADFYSGFYLATPRDGQLCADRDVLHARSGARCDVKRFTFLVPDTRGR